MICWPEVAAVNVAVKVENFPFIGMLPIALGIGVDPSFRSPMAVAVIGGLITSTFLSLLVIPVVYTFVDDVEVLLGRLFRRSKNEAAKNA